MNSFFRPIPALLFLAIFCLYLPAQVYSQKMPTLAPNQLVLPEKEQTLSFIWQQDTIDRHIVPQAALLLPVRLPHCPRQFYMQFDLGAPTTHFYKNKLTSVKARYPKALTIPDSASVLKAYHFQISNMPVTAQEISLLRDGDRGIDWSSNDKIIIGTIGADLIDARVAVLDYIHRKIVLAPELPQAYAGLTQLSDFIYVQRNVILPAVINGRKSMLYFDTGASAYELLTDKKTCESFQRTDSSVTRYPVKSWDRTLISNTYSISDSVLMAGKVLPLKQASFMEGVSDTQLSRMMKMGIGGLIGNRLFLHSIVVLDTRNKKFGVISNP
ncbi:MAG TPA: hypothetical protein VHK91_05760 [Flavisolibacter sp.]|jgi:hypothetical protein|nr:hypothetical protein [Flavisolibacter sp.]